MKNPIVKMTLANVCKGDSRAHVMSPLSFLLFFFHNNAKLPRRPISLCGDVLRSMVKL